MRIYSDSRDNTISHQVSTVLDHKVFMVSAKYTYTKREGHYILVMRKFEELIFGRLYGCPWTIDFA
jgi:hypothetical protein